MDWVRGAGVAELQIDGPVEHALGPAKGVVAGLSLSVLIWITIAALVILTLF